MSDDLFKARNWDTTKAMIGYTLNQLGAGIFYNFAVNGTPTTQKGPLEEFVGLPLVSNVIGRFIRVSDYGVTEKLGQVKTNALQEQSRETLENRKLVNDYVEKAINMTDQSKIRALEQDMVKEKFGGAPQGQEEVTKAKALVSKFRVGLIRGISGPEIDALAGASTNAEKTKLLEQIKGRMSAAEFADLKQTSIREKLVSPEVFNKFEHAK